MATRSAHHAQLRHGTAPCAPTMARTERAAEPPPHFVLAPLAAQGHIIPMVDLARLLAARGARVSLVTTPLNVARLSGVADQAAARSELLPDLVALPMSPEKFGLPADCQNGDMVARNDQFIPFFDAMRELAGPFESYVRALAPPPSCIVADWCNPWTAGVATSLGIPRLFFHGPPCFFSLCELMAALHGLFDRIAAGDEHQTHVVPGMPVAVEVTKGSPPGFLIAPGCETLREEAMEAMRTADGLVVNTFQDLEAEFVASYAAASGKPVWALGPFFLHNHDDAEAMALRGKKATVDQREVAAWLDGHAAGTVVYASFGSIARKLPAQLFEVGHGLEDAGKPFLWVVKESEVATPEAREWLSALEGRTAGRGLVVRGWAPQLAVLSHRATGGFLTHCGWNSVLEAVAHGVPLATWPHFGDQFFNERLAVDVLGVGVPIGAAAPVMILDDDGAVRVARGDVARAVSALMDGGEVGEERRRKAREYGEKARRAMEEGGSSYENLTRLIESLKHSAAPWLWSF